MRSDVGAGGQVDAHGMDPATVLANLAALGGRLPPRTLLVGCRVAETGEGMGLTPLVAAAVDEAVRAVQRLVTGGLRRRRWPEMCLGIPGRVVEMVPGFGDQLALVEVEGAARKVNIGLLDEAPAPGQWVLIHMGFAVELTDAAGAEQAMAGLELMGRSRDDAAEEGGRG